MNEIKAGKSILYNKSTDTTFIASKLDEEVQLSHKNHQHIKCIGELSFAIPIVPNILNELYEEIKHGDEKHQKWLKDKIDLFIELKDL